MANWQKVKISQFLKERKGRYDPGDEAVQGLKRLNKIDFSGEIHLSDKGSKTDMIIVEPGDLVISGINVSKGALAVYYGEEPITATIHYSSYVFDERQIDIDYFKRFVRSQSFVQALKDQVKGGIKTEIKPKHFLPLEIHLPDIESQREIVSFFKRIENEMDDLSGEITHQQSFLKQLRQRILQEAVEGKLTAEWRDKYPDLISGDNHASKLLEKIKAEKERLIKEENTSTKLSARTKKDASRAQSRGKPLAPVAEAEKPFDLPGGWVCCRLQDITRLITDGKHGDCQNKYDSGYYFLSAKDIQDGKLIYENARQITFQDFKEVHRRTNLEPGDLCMVNTGATVGKIAIASNSPFTMVTTFQKSVAVIKVIRDMISSEFIEIFLKGATEKLLKKSWGSAINNLLLGDLKAYLVSLPPFAEQQAIVERVDKLMAMIGELEKQVSERKDQAEMLMQSVLREAFAKG